MSYRLFRCEECNRVSPPGDMRPGTPICPHCGSVCHEFFPPDVREAGTPIVPEVEKQFGNSAAIAVNSPTERVRFVCHGCGKNLTCNDPDLAGKQIECPGCMTGI